MDTELDEEMVELPDEALEGGTTVDAADHVEFMTIVIGDLAIPV